jgi:oligopeptide transport system substrate-binding protein
MSAKKLSTMLGLILIVSMLLTSCATPAPQVVEKVVTQVVTQEKQVIQTQIVEKTVEKQVVVTPTAGLKAAGSKVLHTASGPGDIPTLDPGLSQDTSSVQWVNETTVGLTRLSDDTKIVPGMASKWDISADGLVYTFHLLDNVPWVKWDASKNQVVKVQSCPDTAGKTADRLVTAQDFQYSIVRALDPKTASPYAYVLAFAIAGAADFNSGKITDTAKLGVSVVNTTTLQVKFNEAAAYNANIIGLWTAHAVPKWLIQGDDCTQARAERWTETGFFQGYGPFTLKEWIHDSNATFVKNPFWPGTADIPQPKLDEVDEVFLDAPPAMAEYEAGNLDWLSNTPISEMDRIKSDATLSKELKIAPSLSTYYYGFNTKASVVSDVRVRQALSLAVDRQSIIDNVTKGNQEPAQWFCRPGLAGCPTIKDHPNLGVKFDPAKAKQVLDGYLKEKGTTADKLDITLMFNTSAAHQKIAEAIQQMWKDTLGITVKLVNQEWKVYLNTIQDPKNTPQVWRLGWNLDYPDTNNFDREVASFGGNANPKAGGGFNWQNDKYEALVKQAATEPDPQKRIELYAQAEDILVNQDAVMIPIYWYTSVWLTKPYVQRTFSNTGDQHYEFWDVSAH